MMIKIAIGMLAVYLLGFYTGKVVEINRVYRILEEAAKKEDDRIARARETELHRLGLNREVNHVDG